MTRPNLLVGALAAVCVGTLLWCARLILAADLPRGAHIASWALWVVATVAVVTLIAYVREFLVHRQAVGRDASWKPLPSLVLLWIGGLTALLSFAFILPDKSDSDGAGEPAKADTSLTSQTVTGPSTTTPRGSATTSGTASRSASRTKAPSSTSTSSVTSTSSAGTSPTPARTSSGSSTASATPTPSTTTTIIDLDILPTQARPTTPPGH